MSQQQDTPTPISAGPKTSPRTRALVTAAVGSLASGSGAVTVAHVPGAPTWLVVGLTVTSALTGLAVPLPQLLRLWAVHKLVNVVCGAVRAESAETSRDKRVQEAAALAAKLNES